MRPDIAVLWVYWGVTAVWTVGLLVWLRWVVGGISQPGAASLRLDGQRAGVVLGVALVLRLVFVLGGPVVVSDDVYRYALDGQRLLQGENPYAGTPMEAIERARAAGDDASADWLMQINNRELATIYQPVSQWVFAGSAALHHALFERPLWSESGARVLRGVFSVFDLAAVCVVLFALRRAGRSLWWATLYAWHPLSVTEIAWSGHQDAVGVFWLVLLLTVVVELRRGDARVWVWVWAGVCAAMVAGVKPMVLPLALPVAWGLRRWPMGLGVSLLSCVVVLVALYVPFARMPGGFSELWETSGRFVSAWRFNGSLHPLVEWLTGSKRSADGVMVALILVVYAGLCWVIGGALKAPDPRGGGVDVVWWGVMVWGMALLMVTSTAHPWYALWALVALPMAWGGFGSVTLLVMCYTLTLGYSAWVMPERFAPPAWLQVGSWLAVYAVVVWEVGCQTLRRETGSASA